MPFAGTLWRENSSMLSRPIKELMIVFTNLMRRCCLGSIVHFARVPTVNEEGSDLNKATTVK